MGDDKPGNALRLDVASDRPRSVMRLRFIEAVVDMRDSRGMLRVSTTAEIDALFERLFGVDD